MPIPKTADRDDDRVNRVRAFSAAGEKSGGRGRKRVRRADRTVSPTCGEEKRIVRNWLALLGIVREAGKDARRASASTTGD